jgi:hypothetical protein
VNLLGRAAQVYLPEPLRKLLLIRLFEGAAGAFGRPVPPLRGLSAEELLNAFAQFTACAASDQPASPTVSPRLFEATYRYGKTLRRLLGVTSTQDVMAAARVVYRAIGIDFRGDPRGGITIASCFFSHLYTPGVCHLMSAKDAGLLAGLSDGGRMVFSQRITDGYPSCSAQLLRTGPGAGGP